MADGMDCCLLRAHLRRHIPDTTLIEIPGNHMDWATPAVWRTPFGQDQLIERSRPAQKGRRNAFLSILPKRRQRQRFAHLDRFRGADRSPFGVRTHGAQRVSVQLVCHATSPQRR